ncbi:hypothetical protein GUJ93_ZPchr0009g2322 [Zizania palustris]|uniref:DRBM domain-containing protein n=1 Tax=Zizania palustris TaxID=103762 RepID=A0A8J5VKQ8_ZIZPA|nr:hypothetical protein GUJ93_ZPchr0009g2322 [Zizania palustris]
MMSPSSSPVVINNTRYEFLPGFFDRKGAKQSAAEVGLMEIVKSIPANANIPAVEPSSHNLFLDPYEEAKRVEHEPPGDIDEVQPNKGDRHVKEKPTSDTAIMLQPDGKDRRVEQEPTRDTSMVQPIEECVWFHF